MVLSSKSKSYFMTNCIRYQFLFFPRTPEGKPQFPVEQKKILHCSGFYYRELNLLTYNLQCQIKFFLQYIAYSWSFGKVFSMKLGHFAIGKVYWMDSNGQLALIAYPTYNERSYLQGCHQKFEVGKTITTTPVLAVQC